MNLLADVMEDGSISLDYLLLALIQKQDGLNDVSDEVKQKFFYILRIFTDFFKIDQGLIERLRYLLEDAIEDIDNVFEFPILDAYLYLKHIVS